jgi:hypothetical protein
VNTGSVIITVDAVRTRNVECPMNVTATRPRSTVPGGAGQAASGARAGHGRLWRVRIHLMTSVSGLAFATGLKNRSPSQWPETGYLDMTSA